MFSKVPDEVAIHILGQSAERDLIALESVDQRFGGLVSDKSISTGLSMYKILNLQKNIEKKKIMLTELDQLPLGGPLMTAWELTTALAMLATLYLHTNGYGFIPTLMGCAVTLFSAYKWRGACQGEFQELEQMKEKLSSHSV